MARLVAVLSTIPRLSQHLQHILPDVTFLDVIPGGDSTLLNLSKAEILVADAHLLTPYIDQLPSTKWIQTTWAGLENFVTHIKNKNVPFVITRFTGKSFGHSMSEYVVSHIVNFERDQRKQYENQNNKIWNQNGKIGYYRQLNDLNIGILGLGEIGTCVAKIFKAFGATVWGMTRSLSEPQKDYLDKQLTTKDLKEILQNCDYIVNILPSTEATNGLLNGDLLKNCMEKKSVLINIGRGSIIRESDLINAIENNWISGAILDVFEEEPLPKSSRLWNLPQVTITPHTAGISRSEDIAKVFAENYVKYLKKKPLRNVLDVNRGY